MAAQQVVVLGEARVDEIRDPGGVRELVTGDAVEIATALRGHGLALTVVAPVADDADGVRIRTTLQDRGIRLVPVPATEGTLRRSVVRDRRGTEIELRRGEGSFADTRRSLAAQAEADVIVDLRERAFATIDEVRDEVLAALGLGAASEVPHASAEQGSAPQESAHAPESEPAASSQPGGHAHRAIADVQGEMPRDEASAAPRALRGGAEVPPRVLLPAPIVAGTPRHAPVRLVPEAPAAPAPAPDWHGLAARLSRIAT